MSRTVWLLLSALLLIAAACTSQGSDSTPEAGSAIEEGDDPSGTNPPSTDASPDQTTPDPPGTDPDSTLPGGPAGMESLEDLAGRLAITNRTTLLLIDPTGANGEFIDDVPDGLVAQPTWSPDGAEIAWSRFDPTSFNAAESETAGSLERMTLPDDAGGVEGGERSSTSTGETAPVYLQWSDDASRIGLLSNGDDGIELHTVVGDQAPFFEAAGAPLYFSWSPDNEALAWHLGSELQVRSSRALESLAVTEQTFTAPAWLTDDDVMAVQESRLVLVDPDNGFINELAEVLLPTQFVLHAETGRVAYLAPGSDILSIGFPQSQEPPAEDSPEDQAPEDEAPGDGEPDEDSPLDEGPPPEDQKAALQVLDVRSETLVLVTAEPVLAWEWSSDGQRLAFLAQSDFDDEKLRWYFWQDGQVVGATSQFWPTTTERSVYLPFFAQYTQSHTRWSPDGAAFAFAGIVEDQQGIWVHVLNETPQSILVADGDFVTWSPETVSNGSGISPL